MESKTSDKTPSYYSSRSSSGPPLRPNFPEALKLYKKILTNKRIWKYFIFFATFYKVSYLFFNRWYDSNPPPNINTKTSSSTPLQLKHEKEAQLRKAIEVEEIKEYDPIGENGHRPAEIFLDLFGSFYISYLSWDYRKINIEQLGRLAYTIRNHDYDEKVRRVLFFFGETRSILHDFCTVDRTDCFTPYAGVLAHTPREAHLRKAIEIEEIRDYDPIGTN